jgi:hypothetical protein
MNVCRSDHVFCGINNSKNNCFLAVNTCLLTSWRRLDSYAPVNAAAWPCLWLDINEEEEEDVKMYPLYPDACLWGLVTRKSHVVTLLAFLKDGSLDRPRVATSRNTCLANSVIGNGSTSARHTSWPRNVLLTNFGIGHFYGSNSSYNTALTECFFIKRTLIERKCNTWCVISGFRHDVDKICALLGYYATLSGSSVPTFRVNLLVPSSRVKKSKKSAYFGDRSCLSGSTKRISIKYGIGNLQ